MCSVAVDSHVGLVASAGEGAAVVRAVCAMIAGNLDGGLPLLGSFSSGGGFQVSEAACIFASELSVWARGGVEAGKRV